MTTESYSTVALKRAESSPSDARVTEMQNTSDQWRDSTALDFDNGERLTVYHDDEGVLDWLPLIRVGDAVPLLPHGYIDVGRLAVYLAARAPVVAASAKTACWCGAAVELGAPVQYARGRLMRCDACDPSLRDADLVGNIDELRDQIEAEYWEQAARAMASARAQGWYAPSQHAWADVAIAHQECTRQLDQLGGHALHQPEALLTRSRLEIGVVHGALAWATVYVRPHAGEDGLSVVKDRLLAASSALVVAATARCRDRYAAACDLQTPADLDRKAEELAQPKGLIRDPRLATCLRSLGRVPTKTNNVPTSYEVVVVPDIRAVRQALTADEHSPAQWEALGRLLQAAQHVVVMDPDLDEDDQAFVQSWRSQLYLRVRNDYQPIHNVPVSMMPDPMDAQRYALAAVKAGQLVAILTSGPGAQRLRTRLEADESGVAIAGRDEISDGTRVLLIPPGVTLDRSIPVDVAYIVAFGAPTVGGGGFAPQPATKLVSTLLRSVSPKEIVVGVSEPTASLVTDIKAIRTEIEDDLQYVSHRAMRRCGGWRTDRGRRVRTLNDQYDQAYCHHYVSAVAAANADRLAGARGVRALLAEAGGMIVEFDEVDDLVSRGTTEEEAVKQVKEARTTEAKAHKTARDRVEDQRIEQICAAPQAPADPDARTAFRRELWRAPASDERDAALERDRLEHDVLDRRNLDALPQEVRELLIRRSGGEPSRLRGIDLETAYRVHADYRAQYDGRTAELRRRHTASVQRGYSPHLDQRLPVSEALVAVVGAVTRGARVDTWQAEWTELDRQLFMRDSGHDPWTEITDALSVALATVPGGVHALRQRLDRQLPSVDLPAKLLATILRALGAELKRPRNTKHGGSLRLVDGRTLAVTKIVPSYSVEPSCWRVVLALVEAPKLPSLKPIGRLP